VRKNTSHNTKFTDRVEAGAEFSSQLRAVYSRDVSHGMASSYPCRLLHSYLRRASRRRLRSASRRQLLVPPYNLSTYGRRVFSVACPAAWNYLGDELREPLLTANSFRQLLKTRLFAAEYI